MSVCVDQWGYSVQSIHTFGRNVQPAKESKLPDMVSKYGSCQANAIQQRKKMRDGEEEMWFAAFIKKLEEVAPRRRINCKCHILDAAASVH